MPSTAPDLNACVKRTFTYGSGSTCHTAGAEERLVDAHRAAGGLDELEETASPADVKNGPSNGSPSSGIALSLSHDRFTSTPFTVVPFGMRAITETFTVEFCGM